MSIEIAMISVVGGGVVITGAGLIRLWMKNGKDAARRDGALETQLKGIALVQTETRNDISFLRNDFHDHKEHCASITGGFAEKIKALEKRKR